MANKFFSLALVVLALVAGAWAWRTFVQKPTVTTRIEWYEKPIVIPAKTESKQATVKPPTSETARRDTIINTAPCDSLRMLASRLSRPDSVVFVDSVAFADSLASFSALEITTVEHDPWTRIMTKARRFEDAILKVAKVTTTETTTEINWLASLGAFVLGMLAALLLS